MARKKRSEAREAKKFAIILPFILAAAAGLAWWRGHATAAGVLVGLGLLPPALAFGLPSLWIRFFRGWMKFAEVLSWVSTRVILGVFFFLILTPVSFVMKLLGRAPLDLAWKDGRATYWIDKKEPERTIERYSKSY